jgi:hypothetical protein
MVVLVGDGVEDRLVTALPSGRVRVVNVTEFDRPDSTPPPPSAATVTVYVVLFCKPPIVTAVIALVTLATRLLSR